MKIVLFYGLRRSGNHFIISQIMQLFTNFIHINDVNLSYEKFSYFKNIEITQKRIDNKYTGFKNCDCVLISMENKNIEDDKEEILKFQAEKDVNVVMLLRNPYNNLSSVWKVYNFNINKLETSKQLWIKYANIFMDNKNMFIKILYDEYCCNIEYKKEILSNFKKNFDIQKIDDSKRILYSESSFDYENKKQKIYGFLEDCNYSHDNKFLDFFQDNEINELWKKILNDLNLNK